MQTNLLIQKQNIIIFVRNEHVLVTKLSFEVIVKIDMFSKSENTKNSKSENLEIWKYQNLKILKSQNLKIRKYFVDSDIKNLDQLFFFEFFFFFLMKIFSDENFEENVIWALLHLQIPHLWFAGLTDYPNALECWFCYQKLYLKNISKSKIIIANLLTLATLIKSNVFKNDLHVNNEDKLLTTTIQPSINILL